MLRASPRCLRLSTQSKMKRDTNTAVNRFASKPNVSVVANPFTGPVPKMKRIARNDGGDVRIHDGDPGVAEALDLPPRAEFYHCATLRECARRSAHWNPRPCRRQDHTRDSRQGQGNVDPAMVDHPRNPSKIMRFIISATSALIPAPR